MKTFQKVPKSMLFCSEPAPNHFGNPPNPSGSAGEAWTCKNWLRSLFHFSFAEYRNSSNTNFGALRVLNDDLVQSMRGFGTHPHSDAEIVTYIVQGELTHKDSMGTQETLTRGGIQFMTAGSGVFHSEHNRHGSLPLRFIQMWYTPRQRNLTPNYGSMQGNEALLANRWAHLVTDVRSSLPVPVKVHQDVNIYATLLSPLQSLGFTLGEERQGYLVCLEGEVEVSWDEGKGKERLERHDAAEIKGPMDLSFVTQNQDPVHLLLIEMAKTKDTRF
uniref:Pirin N-terminal domain-containing protein n=1 Tax=Arcella intermedia TaxID=1963864 RepID=A0A6B2LDJ4_9EUKA